MSQSYTSYTSTRPITCFVDIPRADLSRTPEKIHSHIIAIVALQVTRRHANRERDRIGSIGSIDRWRRRQERVPLRCCCRCFGRRGFVHFSLLSLGLLASMRSGLGVLESEAREACHHRFVGSDRSLCSPRFVFLRTTMWDGGWATESEAAHIHFHLSPDGRRHSKTHASWTTLTLVHGKRCFVAKQATVSTCYIQARLLDAKVAVGEERRRDERPQKKRHRDPLRADLDPHRHELIVLGRQPRIHSRHTKDQLATRRSETQ